jgi:hypothetical protein
MCPCTMCLVVVSVGVDVGGLPVRILSLDVLSWSDALLSHYPDRLFRRLDANIPQSR